MLDATTKLPLKDPALFRQANYIAGAWVQADSGKTIAVRNPATGEVIGEVPAMGQAETRRAIEAANAAWPAWRAMLAKDRAVILHKIAALMHENSDDLAAIMTAEQGKPLAEAKGEVVYAASFIEWFADEGRRVQGETIPQNAKGRRILVTKEPIGVFAAITPWNFPAAMITRKAGPGWAAGCTGVIRPASQTPFSALALAVLAERAGMPSGVCNVITGPSGETGKELTSNPIIRKLSFTGSTEVGRVLLSQCAATIKKTSMELGGNAPFIVFDDADLDAAVAGAMAPVTVAGTATQTLAEALAGMALVQLLNPGAPVIFGSFASSMSMQSGAPTFGTPEPALVLYVMAALARRLGVPFRSGGGLCASKIPDAQAAYESAQTMLPTVLAGVNFVLHTAGWLEGGLAMGYEKFMMDVDQAGMFHTMLEGIDVSENGQAMDAINEVGPGKHFLGCAHTQANFENAFYRSPLADNNSFEQWDAEGALDMAQRANRQYKKMLEDYVEPPLDVAVDDALLDFMARRKAAAPDSNI